MAGHAPARRAHSLHSLHSVTALAFPVCLGAALLGACSRASDSPARDSAARDSAAPAAGASAAADAIRPLATAEGFSGPEAVRYDPDQDVYFVANFNGGGNDRDNNGFISRLRPDGTVDRLRFIAGGVGRVTLHAPRGMTIVGDTLWAADVDAVRGFNRRTGAPVASVPFDTADVGFLNDVAPGPDGAIYVTDTGKNRIYRIAGRKASVAVTDSALGGPNGITWDGGTGRFLIVPYGGGHNIHAWKPGTRTLEVAGTISGAQLDGVEVLSGGRVLIASQADSSLHLFSEGRDRQVVRTTGDPADIGVDTKRNRVAVPYVALNRVDIWEIPRD